MPDVDSGKRDPLLDTQCARMLYFCYKDIPLCSMCRLARDPGYLTGTTLAPPSGRI